MLYQKECYVEYIKHRKTIFILDVTNLKNWLNRVSTLPTDDEFLNYVLLYIVNKTMSGDLGYLVDTMEPLALTKAVLESNSDKSLLVREGRDRFLSEFYKYTNKFPHPDLVIVEAKVDKNLILLDFTAKQD